MSSPPPKQDFEYQAQHSPTISFNKFYALAENNRMAGKAFKIYAKVMLLAVPLIMWPLFIYTVIKGEFSLDNTLGALLITCTATLIVVLSAFGMWGKFLKFAEKVSDSETAADVAEAAKSAAALDALHKITKIDLRLSPDLLRISTVGITVRIGGSSRYFSCYELITARIVPNAQTFSLYLVFRVNGLYRYKFTKLPLSILTDLKSALAAQSYHRCTVTEISAQKEIKQLNKTFRKAAKQQPKPSGLGSHFVLPLVFGVIFTAMSVLFTLAVASDGFSQFTHIDILSTFVSEQPLIGVILFFMVGIYLLTTAVSGLFNALIKYIKLKHFS
ncbi:MAG: hypothetical protein FWH03_04050 [Firmicutes bacterium]|nr:hypothetical protein [Bacillota bacterium]